MAARQSGIRAHLDAGGQRCQRKDFRNLGRRTYENRDAMGLHRRMESPLPLQASGLF